MAVDKELSFALAGSTLASREGSDSAKRALEECKKSDPAQGACVLAKLARLNISESGTPHDITS